MTGPRRPVQPQEIVVAIGDVLEIVSEQYPKELGALAEVERDGSVLLPVLGRVEVFGLSRVELERLLNERYAEHFDGIVKPTHANAFRKDVRVRVHPAGEEARGAAEASEPPSGR